jgi:hypothetical protein
VSDRPEPDLPCQCGHPAEVHEHWRFGTDCGVCGKLVCRSYRPVRPERPVLTWLRDRLERVRGIA